MSNLSINNVQNTGINGVNFCGKSKEYDADNKVSKDEGMKTSTKLMIGATALATAVIGGLALKNIKATKKAFQEGVNHVEQNTIKETTASKAKKYDKINYDEAPISRKQAIFEKEFAGNKKLAYINPEYEKEFAKFEELGGKVSVKDLANGEKEIKYIYPEDSVFESKVVRGKVADIEKGYDWNAKDSKFVEIKLKESEGGHTYGLILRNDFKVSDGGKYEVLYDGANQWGFIKPQDVFEKGAKHWIECGKLSKQAEEVVSQFFKNELGLLQK